MKGHEGIRGSWQPLNVNASYTQFYSVTYLKCQRKFSKWELFKVYFVFAGHFSQIWVFFLSQRAIFVNECESYVNRRLQQGLLTFFVLIDHCQDFENLTDSFWVKIAGQLGILFLRVQHFLMPYMLATEPFYWWNGLPLGPRDPRVRNPILLE